MFIVKWIQGGLTRQDTFDEESDAIERYDELEDEGIFYISLDEADNPQ